MSDLKNTINNELNRAFNKEASNLSFGPNGTNDIKNYTSMMTDLSSTKKEVHEDDEDIEKEETKEATGAGSAGGFESPLFSEPKKNDLFQPGTKTKLTKGGPVNEDEIPGGLADGMTLKDLAKHHDTTIDELIDKVSDGINVEMEHTSSIPIALEIALDHIYEDLNYYGKLEKIEAKESTTSASVGAYDVPIGGGRKDPLQIDTPKSVYGKLRSVKDPKFPKLGGPGSTFVKVKDKCKKFPYCNQGDIKALEFFENNLVKEGIKNISKRYNLNEDYIKGVILENTNIYYKNTDMNKEIENMIDGIVEKVLSEEINKKAKQITESVTEEIDEMDEFYEIALKRKEERMEAKNAKPDFLDLDGDGNKKESMKKAAKDKKETDEEVEEGNEFSGARQDAIDAGKDKFEVDGKTYPVKESLQLTEEEMIDLIEKIIQEEKIEGIKTQDSAMKQSKKDTDSYMKDLIKKFKDYLKDGSEGKFDMEPKTFPKGNNELGNEERVGYTASDSAEEYLKHLSRAGGQENVQTDEIGYDEERIDKYINGHSETGNSSEYANAIHTDINSDEVDERRKENLYTKAKKHTSYNRVPQPVTDEVAGNKKGNAKLAKLTSEQENKKEMKLNENIERMKQMFSHNFKSQ